MQNTGELYTSATWKVRPGREAEFIAAWQAFADWTSEHQPGAGTAVLLQNEENPQSFLSFGPWESAERIAEWRARPEFQDLFAQARALCDDVQPQTLRQVGTSRPR